MIHIKTAQLEDLNSIVAIEQHIFNTDSYPPFVIRQLFDISGHNFLVAKEANQVIGYAIGGLNTDTKQGWILSLGVDKKARGKGLGKQLTLKLIEILTSKNVNEIALTVYPDNKAALKIYKNLGFEGEEILDNYFLDQEKRIVMTLKTDAD